MKADFRLKDQREHSKTFELENGWNEIRNTYVVGSFGERKWFRDIVVLFVVSSKEMLDA